MWQRPLKEDIDQEQMLKMQSMGRSELLVVMPVENRFIEDVQMYKKTEKYLQQKATASQQDMTQRILTDKRFQNTERQRKAREDDADAAGQGESVCVWK